MSSKISWYGVKEVDEYFKFIDKHPKKLFPIFSTETKEVKDKRKYLSDRYYDFAGKTITKVVHELIPFLFDRSSYASFRLGDGKNSDNISTILNDAEVDPTIYKSTSIVKDIMLSKHKDQNKNPFFQSITHECMFYIKSSKACLSEIKQLFNLDFNIDLGEEPPLGDMEYYN